MEEWKTRLTMAAMMATEPWWQGRRKCTVSTEAVTTGPRATVLAARPAQMSIQLSTCSTPPCAMKTPSRQACTRAAFKACQLHSVAFPLDLDRQRYSSRAGWCTEKVAPAHREWGLAC